MEDEPDTKSGMSRLGRDLYNVHLDDQGTQAEGPGAASGASPRGAGVTESDFMFCRKKTEKESPGESGAHSVPVVSVLSDSYNMNYPRRGHAMIINNERFSYDLRRQGLGDRNGTREDERNLKKQLGKLGFDVKAHYQCSADKMLTLCKEAAEMDHSECDCFVCVILSHGEEGVVFGTNKAVELKELFKPFRGNKCRSLAGKPKLFFIQACRGYQTDAGVDVTVSHGKDETDAGRVYPDIIKLPVDADFLFAYSTVPGYYSWRNSSVGSWFIKALCAVLEERGTDVELTKLLTIVNRVVALNFRSSNPDNPDFHHMKQIPCITSMLTKDVYFSAKKK